MAIYLGIILRRGFCTLVLSLFTSSYVNAVLLLMCFLCIPAVIATSVAISYAHCLLLLFTNLYILDIVLHLRCLQTCYVNALLLHCTAYMWNHSWSRSNVHPLAKLNSKEVEIFLIEGGRCSLLLSEHHLCQMFQESHSSYWSPRGEQCTGPQGIQLLDYRPA